MSRREGGYLTLDVLTKQQRKRCMSAIRNKDTRPEMVVRRLVHSLGYRYRLHGSGLPGKPDLIFPSRWKVIFVHGCFWHRHSCQKGKSIPSTREKFWREKLESNKIRDKGNRRKLRKVGWQALIVWECETKPSRMEHLQRKIVAYLES